MFLCKVYYLDLHRQVRGFGGGRPELKKIAGCCLSFGLFLRYLPVRSVVGVLTSFPKDAHNKEVALSSSEGCGWRVDIVPKRRAP